MSDPLKRVSATHDAKGRLISIFVGAVLLPSLALSYVTFDFVPQLAKGRKGEQFKQAEKVLYYIEKELAHTAREKALKAARAVGTERLIDGRPEVIREGLREAGFDPGAFVELYLEGKSRWTALRQVAKLKRGGVDIPRDVLATLDSGGGTDGEDSVMWEDAERGSAGILRYRYACEYVHGLMIREYFEADFNNPDKSLVIRVSEPDGEVVYETAPTVDKKFEVHREMTTPSFKGLKLSLRHRDLSIEEDVRRWEMGTLCLIAFIDLMLGAGLFLIYSNVRREVHLSRLKSDFVANVSHELKTPLALIRLFAETLELGRVQGQEKARQYYRVINKESQRLTALINNILDFSRIEAGRKEYRFAPADVARIVHEVLESYRFQIEQQGFTLETSVAEDIPEVSVDEEALGQALLNLVNNAIKYSRDDKRIRVEVRVEGSRVLLSVTDQGIGVSKGEQKRIFEKFYRGESSLVHETKGSGLGLSLVQHIMEAHGGTVEVESVPGKGSRFTLSLPVARGAV